MGEKEITVYIKNLHGGTNTHRVSENCTLEELIEKQNDRSGMPVDQQRLIFAGRCIYPGDTSLTLLELGISDHAVLHLVLRLRGGLSLFEYAFSSLSQLRFPLYSPTFIPSLRFLALRSFILSSSLSSSSPSSSCASSSSSSASSSSSSPSSTPLFPLTEDEVVLLEKTYLTLEQRIWSASLRRAVRRYESEKAAERRGADLNPNIRRKLDAEQRKVEKANQEHRWPFEILEKHWTSNGKKLIFLIQIREGEERKQEERKEEDEAEELYGGLSFVLSYHVTDRYPVFEALFHVEGGLPLHPNVKAGFQDRELFRLSSVADESGFDLSAHLDCFAFLLRRPVFDPSYFVFHDPLAFQSLGPVSSTTGLSSLQYPLFKSILQDYLISTFSLD